MTDTNLQWSNWSGRQTSTPAVVHEPTSPAGFVDAVADAQRLGVAPRLLAGVRISIGDWVLGANLQDELKGFMELAHAET